MPFVKLRATLFWIDTWVATQDLSRSGGHPFYARPNQILDEHDFDGFVEDLCARFYADEGRPGLPPGRYVRLLLIGYFEGLDVGLGSVHIVLGSVGEIGRSTPGVRRDEGVG